MKTLLLLLLLGIPFSMAGGILGSYLSLMLFHH